MSLRIRGLAVVVALLLLTIPLRAAVSIIAEGGIAATSVSATTTSSATTTGATSLFVSASWFCLTTANVDITDSKSNGYTKLTKREEGTSGVCTQWSYDITTPTVGTGHTFTATSVDGDMDGYAVVCYVAASGVSAFDVQNGANSAAVSSIATGSVNPSASGALLLASVVSAGITHTINNSFTGGFVTDFSTGVTMGGGCKRLIHTTGAMNPTWSWSGTSDAAAAIAAFSATASGCHSRRALLGVGRC